MEPLKFIIEADARAAEAFAHAYGYQEELTDEKGEKTPNPETKQEFMKGCLEKFVREVCGAHDKHTSDEIARIEHAKIVPVEVKAYHLDGKEETTKGKSTR